MKLRLWITSANYKLLDSDLLPTISTPLIERSTDIYRHYAAHLLKLSELDFEKVFWDDQLHEQDSGPFGLG